tara:strand:- start:3274 stop:3846 length:573 start_codon:yes stop_codon:yes gene_type:complete
MMSSQEIPDVMKTVTPIYAQPKHNDTSTILFYLKILLGLVIVSLLGFNILQYLQDGTDVFGNFLQRLGIGGAAIAKKGIKSIAPPIKKHGIKKVSDEEIYDDENEIQKEEDKLQLALEKRAEKAHKLREQTQPSSHTDSSIGSVKKSGYCYLGTDRTYRSCVEVGASDECMSGQVFPTKDLCINPNLRTA